MKNILTIFCFITLSCHAQKEAAQWRFGNQAGLNFQNGAPTTVSTNIAAPAYSFSGIADSLGNLLFYVYSGSVVYNKNNDTMANGFGISSSIHNSGTQASIVIRKSGSQYYVISHNNENYVWTSPIAPMTSYAIVDMNLASGLGSVTTTSVTISAVGLAQVGKMAATKHCNQKDHWLLRHQGGFPGTNNYQSYLVTSAGISTTAVISSIGALQTQAYIQAHVFYRGVHKFSPNGRKVAATLPYRTVELYDFDNSTGVLSNAIKLDTITNPPFVNGVSEANSHGAEFSPDGTKLYVTYGNKHPFLCQFNLCAGSPAAIAASKTIISYDTLNSGVLFYPIQLGINGKIYVNNSDTLYASSIGVINNPNALGAMCNYQPKGQPLGPSTLYPYLAGIGWGLPNFESNFFEQKPVLGPISSSIVCGQVNFAAPSLCAAAGYSVSARQWNFNDTISSANTSILSNPSHVFSANGSYTVQLVLNYYPCGTDTLKQTINITGLPTLSITGNKIICKGESTILSFLGGNNYSINNNVVLQNTAEVQPTVSTVYTISTTNTVTGCSALKTISITVRPCTSINNSSAEQFNFNIYPNPSEGVFMIESDAPIFIIKVYNQLGMLVYQGLTENGKHNIDLSNQANGIYFVEVQNKNSLKTQKLIKW